MTYATMLKLLEPLRDGYERQQVGMCERDANNERLLQLVLKHLLARRQKVSN